MKTILQVAVPTLMRTTLDYLPPPLLKSFAPGVRVLVPFRNKEVVGILMNVVNETSLDPAKIKSAIEVLDDEPILSPNLLELLRFASQYYHYPIGEVLNHCI